MNIIKVKQNFDDVLRAVDGRALVVAATKTVPKHITDKLSGIGVTDAGENRVQEFTDKYSAESGLNWHFIGQLQSNKVKYIIGKTVLIHSLDRLSLASELQRQAGNLGIKVKALIELNIAGEEGKGGVDKGELYSFANELKKFPNIETAGIMSVPPHGVEIEELKGYYGELLSLYNGLRAKLPTVRFLSAGMSEDYELALDFGANIVRIGRGIFGDRSGAWEDLPIG